MRWIPKEIRELGNLTQREAALQNYYLDPRYCETCGIMILVRIKEKPSETKQKRFCSKSCAAKSNNRKFPKKIAKVYFCQECGTKVKSYRKFCDKCLRQKMVTQGKKLKKDQIQKNNYNDWSNINQMTKLEIYGKTTWWNAKATITAHARKDYLDSGRLLCCKVCGYDKHIDICHKKPIKDFPDDAKIGEINDLNNLISLCKNHHWELDKGDLTV